MAIDFSRRFNNYGGGTHSASEIGGISLLESFSPTCFLTMITNWIAEILRSQGVRVIVYLDDFLLASQNRVTLTSQVPKVLDILRSLGWHIKDQKCILEPCQEIEFLGLVWNTHSNIIRLPRAKVESISMTLNSMITSKDCSLKQLQSLLGSLNFANFAIHRGRLHCRHLQRFLKEFQQGRQREKRSIRSHVLAELDWWK